MLYRKQITGNPQTYRLLLYSQIEIFWELYYNEMIFIIQSTTESSNLNIDVAMSDNW